MDSSNNIFKINFNSCYEIVTQTQRPASTLSCKSPTGPACQFVAQSRSIPQISIDTAILAIEQLNLYISQKYSTQNAPICISMSEWQKKGLPYHFAVENGDAKLVHHLNMVGANVNQTDRAGFTALQEACKPENNSKDRTRKFRVIQELMEARANPTQRDPLGKLPLEYIVENKLFPSKNILALLQIQSDVTETSCFLHHCNDIEIIDFLIKSGVSVNTVNSKGITPLTCALERFVSDKGLNTDVIVAAIKHLYNHGADLKNINPFFYLAKKVNYPLLHFFLDAGCDINQVDAQGDNVFMWACENKQHEDFLLELIKLGCDPFKKNIQGNCPLQILLYDHLISSQNLLPFLERYPKGTFDPFLLHCTDDIALVDYFLEAGIPIDTLNNKGCTPLQSALRKFINNNGKGEENIYRLIKHLCMRGADIDTAMVFHYLVVNKLSNFLSFFKNAGGDINQVDTRGNSPLMLACKNSLSEGFLLYLLDLGCDPFQRNLQGEYPLQLLRRDSLISEKNLESLHSK